MAGERASSLRLRLDNPDWHCVQDLTQAAVDERLRSEGPNELPGAHHRSIIAIALEVNAQAILDKAAAGAAAIETL